jgi:hypothetical protein
MDRTLADNIAGAVKPLLCLNSGDWTLRSGSDI